MKSEMPDVVIDIAALGMLSDGSSALSDLCDNVQAVCRPWLSPTTCVICARLVAWMQRGVVAQSEDGQLALTAAGRDQLKALVTLPTAVSCHGLLPLIETLKLALADQLDAHQRQALLHELVQLRARCLSAQSELGPAAPQLLRRCVERRRHAASLAEEALARAIARHDHAHDHVAECHS